MKVTPKNKKELLLHAVMFESIAIVMVTPLMAFVLDKPLTTMGVFTMICCFIAMSWNMVFNKYFEMFEKARNWSRTFKIRLIHIFLFQIGLMLIVVPFGAVWLKVGMFESLIINFSVLAFFLPYGFIFNWVFDKIRAKIITI